MPRLPALHADTAVVRRLVVVEFLSGVLQGAFPVLLPGLAGTLHFGAGDQALVLGVGYLVSGITVPLASRLGDLFGHRRLLLLTLAITFVGFFLSAAAPGLALLLVGQALAGLLTCWLPLELALLRDRLGDARGGRAVGPLVGALLLGTVLGDALRPGLWILAALPAISLVLVWRSVPESVTRAVGRVDWRGVALLTLGLGLMFGAFSSVGHAVPAALVIALLAVSAVLLALFVREELRTDSPTVDVRVLARRATAPVFGLSFLLGCILYGAQSPTLSFEAADPHRVGYGLNADSQTLGLLSLPAVLGATIGAIAADRLARRLGARALLAAGYGLAVLGFTAIALSHGDAVSFVIPSCLCGFGAGLGLSLLPGLLMHRLPADQTATGAGVYNTLKTLAGAATGAIGAALLDSVLLRSGVPAERAYVTIWVGCAVLCAVGVPVALALRNQAADDHAAAAAPALV